MATTSTRQIGLAAGIVGFGIVADRLLILPPGIGLTALALSGLALFHLAGGGSPWAWGFLSAAAGLMLFATLRTAGWLVALDALAAWSLAAVGMSFALAGDPRLASIRSYVRALFAPVRRIPDGLRLLAPFERTPGARTPRTVALAGTVLASTAVAGVFVVVLAHADPVFAHVVRAPFESGVDGETIFHLGVILSVALAAAAVLATARRPAVEGPAIAGMPGVPPHTWTAVLATSCGVFALFLLVHLPTMYLQRDAVLASVGVTPASYAREGFVQMVVASALTLVLVGAMWVSGGSESRPARIAGLILLGMNVAVLASAFHRLMAYEDAFGWTVARLLGHVGILWLAAVLLLTMGALAIGSLRTIPSAMVGLAVVALIGLNLVNPDAFIATRNLERPGPVDMRYLAGLSEDAVPAIASSLPTSVAPSPLIAAIVASGACEDRPAPSFNLGHVRAAASAEPYC